MKMQKAKIFYNMEQVAIYLKFIIIIINNEFYIKLTL